MLVEGFEIDENNLPNHIGIIMDGNYRWAQKNGLSRFDGHKNGVAALRNLLNFAYDVLHLNIISLYAFSIENWKRTKEEVSFLMRLFLHFYKNEFQDIKKRKVRIIHSGTDDNLPASIKKTLVKMSEETKDNTRGTINLAFNYGGRNEIVEAAKRLALDFKNDKIDIKNISENAFEKYLFHPDLPDPDLIIRTSGEQRISNFLLWQSAYSELYFTETLWPDFNPAALVEAISDYQKRERRFGGR